MNNYNSIYEHFKSLFGSMVVVFFQITFHAEIHVNDIFYFLKIIFNMNISKQFKKYKSYLILTKINFKFNKMQLQIQYQIDLKSPSKTRFFSLKKNKTNEEGN